MSKSPKEQHSPMSQWEQDRVMREHVQEWIYGAEIWHFVRVTDEISSLLNQHALGSWFVLADASPQQTIGLIVCQYQEHWTVQTDRTQAREEHTTSTIQHWFEWLQADVRVQKGIPIWCSDEKGV